MSKQEDLKTALKSWREPKVVFKTQAYLRRTLFPRYYYGYPFFWGFLIAGIFLISISLKGGWKVFFYGLPTGVIIGLIISILFFGILRLEEWISTFRSRKFYLWQDKLLILHKGNEEVYYLKEFKRFALDEERHGKYVTSNLILQKDNGILVFAVPNDIPKEYFRKLMSDNSLIEKAFSKDEIANFPHNKSGEKV